MMNMFKNLFKIKKNIDISEYEGFSDFFRRAPKELQKEVIAEAARKANEDQMKVFKQAQMKVQGN